MTVGDWSESSTGTAAGLRVDRRELEQQRAEDDAGERAEAADDDAREQQDRQRERERVAGSTYETSIASSAPATPA